MSSTASSVSRSSSSSGKSKREAEAERLRELVERKRAALERAKERQKLKKKGPIKEDQKSIEAPVDVNRPPENDQQTQNNPMEPAENSDTIAALSALPASPAVDPSTSVISPVSESGFPPNADRPLSHTAQITRDDPESSPSPMAAASPIPSSSLSPGPDPSAPAGFGSVPSLCSPLDSNRAPSISSDPAPFHPSPSLDSPAPSESSAPGLVHSPVLSPSRLAPEPSVTSPLSAAPAVVTVDSASPFLSPSDSSAVDRVSSPFSPGESFESLSFALERADHLEAELRRQQEKIERLKAKRAKQDNAKTKEETNSQPPLPLPPKPRVVYEIDQRRNIQSVNIIFEEAQAQEKVNEPALDQPITAAASTQLSTEGSISMSRPVDPIATRPLPPVPLPPVPSRVEPPVDHSSSFPPSAASPPILSVSRSGSPSPVASSLPSPSSSPRVSPLGTPSEPRSRSSFSSSPLDHSPSPIVSNAAESSAPVQALDVSASNSFDAEPAQPVSASAHSPSHSRSTSPLMSHSPSGSDALQEQDYPSAPQHDPPSPAVSFDPTAPSAADSSVSLASAAVYSSSPVSALSVSHDYFSIPPAIDEIEFERNIEMEQLRSSQREKNNGEEAEYQDQPESESAETAIGIDSDPVEESESSSVPAGMFSIPLSSSSSLIAERARRRFESMRAKRLASLQDQKDAREKLRAQVDHKAAAIQAQIQQRTASPKVKHRSPRPAAANSSSAAPPATASSKRSNRQILANALTFVCLAGSAPSVVQQRSEALGHLKAAPQESSHFLVLLSRSRALAYRALYWLNLSHQSAVKICGDSSAPELVHCSQVEEFFKYDSAAKQFIIIPKLAQFAPTTDAFVVAKKAKKPNQEV